MSKGTSKILLAIGLTLPCLALRLSGVALAPPIATAVYGTGIVAASFLLAWAAEVAQMDVSASAATAALALIAVLPEYAVDLYFAYTAGHKPSYAAYAAANMTGSNRLLIGVGWPLVVLLFLLWASRRVKGSARDRCLHLEEGRRIDLGFLGAACIYAFLIPLKGTLAVYDAVVLIGLYGVYMWRISQEESEEPELIGVAAEIGRLSVKARRSVVGGFLGLAAVAILFAAKPFADSLVETGKSLGVDEFLLVQWLAPLASEAPELLVAAILALRAHQDAALGTLLSSKVNQWTLLVGSLPLAYAVGGGGAALPLDPRQNEEFALTAAQALFGFAVLAKLKLGVWESAGLFGLFAAQLFVPGREARLGFAAVYGALSVVLLVAHRKAVVATFREALPVRRA
jgi:cation:H+ antiporter